MKKIAYKRPLVEVIELDNVDIITASTLATKIGESPEGQKLGGITYVEITDSQSN